MPRKYVLLSTQRSGSTWAIDMLNSHPAVVCYGALFLPEGTGRTPAGAQDLTYFSTYLAERGRARATLARPLEAWRFLDRIYRPRPDVEAIGFKLMYSQFRVHPWVLAYIGAKRIPVVHLVRRNKLDHVLSRLGAKARGRFHARPGEALETPRIHLDPAELLAQMEHEERKVAQARRVLSLLRPSVLEISYEELAADNTAFERIFEFVGVRANPAGVNSELRKWGRGSYAERIENYEDVKAALADTRFAPLLESTP